MRSISLFVAVSAFLTATSALAQGRIVKVLSDPIAIYNESGAELARVKARDFPIGPVKSEKGLSWLQIEFKGEPAQVRRGDVVYESAASACVTSAGLSAPSGIGTAGSRAGTNAGAGAGGAPCIPTGR